MNYRLSEVNAVLAIEQLKRVRRIASRRHRLGEQLARGIEGLPGVKLLRPPSHSKSSYWYGVLLVDEAEAGTDGPGFAKALFAEGIVSGAPVSENILKWPIFRALNKNPNAFRTYCPPGLKAGRFDAASCPNANAMARRTVRVHLNEFVTVQDVRDTIRAIRKVARWYREHGSRGLG